MLQIPFQFPYKKRPLHRLAERLIQTKDKRHAKCQQGKRLLLQSRSPKDLEQSMWRCVWAMQTSTAIQWASPLFDPRKSRLTMFNLLNRFEPATRRRCPSCVAMPRCLNVSTRCPFVVRMSNRNQRKCFFHGIVSCLGDVAKDNFNQTFLWPARHWQKNNNFGPEVM